MYVILTDTSIVMILWDCVKECNWVYGFALCPQVLCERHALGTQLIRRNDEVALLYEKIKIQQAILNRGETEYRQRMEDMRILKLEIKKLRREKGILGKSAANVEELR